MTGQSPAAKQVPYRKEKQKHHKKDYFTLNLSPPSFFKQSLKKNYDKN